MIKIKYGNADEPNSQVPDFYDMVGQLSYYGKIPDILE